MARPVCFYICDMTLRRIGILAALLAAVVAAGCSPTAPEQVREDVPEIIGPWPEGNPGVFRVLVGDLLKISVLYTPSQTATAVWYLDGKEAGRGKDFSYTPDAGGEHLLRLEVSTRAGIAVKEAKVLVEDPALAPTWNIHKGVNIGNWISQSSKRGTDRDKAITESHIKKIAAMGFDHIRLPVDEEQLFTEAGNLDPECLALVKRTVDYCQRNGLRVLLDLHIIRSHHFNDKVNPLWTDLVEQEHFLDMWRKIDAEMHAYPADLLAYEPLNEPVADDPAPWNALFNRFIRQIRETDQERVLVIEANRWGGYKYVSKLDIPADDPNLMLQMHFYEPHLMTAYQASWNKFANLNFATPMTYPGKLISDAQFYALTDEEKDLCRNYYRSYDKQVFAGWWKDAIDFAKKKGLRLLLGEFGCLTNCGVANRNAWLSDVVALCKENGMPYSYWEFNHSYGFADKDGNVTAPDILSILTSD